MVGDRRFDVDAARQTVRRLSRAHSGLIWGPAIAFTFAAGIKKAVAVGGGLDLFPVLILCGL